jgi:hypothetical protein
MFHLVFDIQSTEASIEYLQPYHCTRIAKALKPFTKADWRYGIIKMSLLTAKFVLDSKITPLKGIIHLYRNRSPEHLMEQSSDGDSLVACVLAVPLCSCIINSRGHSRGFCQTNGLSATERFAFHNYKRRSPQQIHAANQIQRFKIYFYFCTRGSSGLIIV